MLVPILIGAGGTHIKNIERETDCELHVDIEHSSVSIFARSAESMKRAKIGVNSLAGDVFPGQLYSIQVTKITDMGIHVRFEEHPGREGFIHITEMFDEPRHQKIEDLYRVGDVLNACAIGYDSRGKLLMTLRDPTQSPPNPLLFTYISPVQSNALIKEDQKTSTDDARKTVIRNILDMPRRK